jgi:ubiquinone/menaquinone biosynthesis C-methylase UbiE
MHNQTYPEMYRSEDTHFWFLGKRLFIDSILHHRKLTPPQILDIGCGTGGTTKFLSKWGKVTGIEQNSQAASLATKRGIRVIRGSAHHLPFQKSKFGLVTILDVLYHKGIKELSVLQEAFRVLKPQGLLLVMDSSIPWLWSHHDIVMDAKYRYTKKQLVTHVQHAGFIVDTASYIYSSTLPFLILSRMITNITRSTSLPHLPSTLNQIVLKLIAFEASLFLHIRLPIGSSLLILAHKP